MFSPRTIVLLAVVAAAAAGPLDRPPAPADRPDDFGADLEEAFPWNFPFGGFANLKNIFTPFFNWFPKFSFEDFGPRINATDDNFRVIMDAKSYKKEDLKVKVKGDYIVVQGSHEAKRDEHDLFASQFFNSYSLPANSSAAAVTATLTSDGYLVVDAPIDGAGGEAAAERDVPIVESGRPLEQGQQQPGQAGQAVTSPAPETSTAEREEVTDRDNDIPHGTESELTP